MSFYHLMNGVTPATFIILPMLGKHPDEYPRFRDCFIKDENHPEYEGYIHVYTRTGGNNREAYAEQNEEIKKHPNYVTNWDDSFDNTYAMWVFSIPEKWKEDYKKLITASDSISDEYKEEIKRVYPKLATEIDEIFSKKPKKDATI